MIKLNESLLNALALAQIPLTLSDQQAEPESPWFVKALLALAGWIAAIFILGFIAVGFVALIESSAASLVLGVFLMAGGYALLRFPKNDFVEHLALAGSLAGQLLAAWAIGSALEDVSAGFWAALALLQASLALLMPNFVHRVFSSFAFALALSLALSEAGAPYLAGSLMLWAILYFWLNEFRYPARLRVVQALAYGLTLGLLAIQLLNRFGSQMSSWHANEISTQPWMGELIIAFAGFYLIWKLFERQNQAESRFQLAAYASFALLCLGSFWAYGLSHGILVVILGFAIGNRLLIALGVVSLLFSISSYYYLLEVTLLIKAQTLLALGLIILIARWLMLRLNAKPKEQSHE